MNNGRQMIYWHVQPLVGGNQVNQLPTGQCGVASSGGGEGGGLVQGRGGRGGWGTKGGKKE